VSVELLERAARELTPFLDEVASRLAWHDFEARLRAHGLRHDMSSPVICRWRAGKGYELLLDVMPGDATLLGFENRWQLPALEHAVTCSLPSGRSIRAISPPYLVATKLEAWKGRGRGDHFRSHDLEDIIGLVDGRAELVDEVAASPDDLRAFLSCEIEALLQQPRFLDALDGTVIGFGDGGSGSGAEDRVDDVLLPRFHRLAGG